MSHCELKLNHETLLASHKELLEQHASLIKVFSKKLKNNESSSHESSDQLLHLTNSCDVGKKHVSISCDDLLEIPCSSYIDACTTSLSCETNLLKENNELKNEVKKLSNKLERCYNTKITFEHMLNNKRSYGDMSDIGFNKSMTKGERKRERKMKKEEQKRLSHFMCYKCHEMGHLEKGCPNLEKLKLKKEKRCSSMSSASSVAHEVISPLCAQPSNW